MVKMNEINFNVKRYKHETQKSIIAS